MTCCLLFHADLNVAMENVLFGELVLITLRCCALGGISILNGLSVLHLSKGHYSARRGLEMQDVSSGSSQKIPTESHCDNIWKTKV